MKPNAIVRFAHLPAMVLIAISVVGAEELKSPAIKSAKVDHDKAIAHAADVYRQSLLNADKIYLSKLSQLENSDQVDSNGEKVAVIKEEQAIRDEMDTVKNKAAVLTIGNAETAQEKQSLFTPSDPSKELNVGERRRMRDEIKPHIVGMTPDELYDAYQSVEKCGKWQISAATGQPFYVHLLKPKLTGSDGHAQTYKFEDLFLTVIDGHITSFEQ